MPKFRAVFAAVLFLIASFSCSAADSFGQSRFSELYATEACTLLRHPDSISIAGMVCKGEAVLVLSPYAVSKFFHENYQGWYHVRSVRGEKGYICSKYLTRDSEQAKIGYRAAFYDPLHAAAIDKFKGGSPLGCDYFPEEKAQFESKKMPEQCYCLYLTCSAHILKNIDSYIDLAKQTRINCFVIDIKEDGMPGFKADAMKEFAPSAYAKAPDNLDLYRKIVQKMHSNGLWAVGRIVTFKDYHLTKDHPEYALWDKEADQMLLHNKSHWPSAYCRKVWEYNVALACEAVDRIGFDEINFDYVRFPDRMTSIENTIDMRNVYGESKVQAIQRFVKYAAERIRRHGAYVSIDVFGESANPGYTTAYGQYWPAISNYCDVICGMPYPDHFSNGYYGIKQPWNHPYEIMHAWGERVQARQSETPSPARVRTWVQAYHVMRHVDPNGIDYNAENIEKEIRGLYAAGLTGGYTTWLSSSNIDRYRSQAAAFSIDYLE